MSIAHIYPKVKEASLSTGILKLPREITIVRTVVNLSKVKEVLQDCGIFCKEVSENAVVSVFLTNTIEHEEGYELSVTKTNILIHAKTETGVYFAFLTLAHLIKNAHNNELPLVTIKDYPSVRFRGVIEGFYGFPWTDENRKDIIRFSSNYKCNTYIYAPKDDMYHRHKWRELYLPEKAHELRELVSFCNDQYVSFVWTIHPGETIDLKSEEDFNSIINKFEHLYSLGVRQFGVLFDDVHCATSGKEQADCINRINRDFVIAKGDIKPIITVGTRYCEAWGPSMTDYFKIFEDVLDSDVEIMWTGAQTVSNIGRMQFDAPKRVTGNNRNLSVWWNYPVNDYCDSKLLMGKIENLLSDVDNINGFFTNPMNQCQASKQAIFCVANYCWNIKGYDNEATFNHSFIALQEDIAEELKIFAMHCSYVKENAGTFGEFFFDESWNIKDDIQVILTKLKSQDFTVTEPANAIGAEMAKLSTAVRVIREKCKNKDLLLELQPFLCASEFLAQAVTYILDGIAHVLKGENSYELVGRANNTVRAMEDFKILRLKDGKEIEVSIHVGTYRLLPFIKGVAEMLVKENKKLIIGYVGKGHLESVTDADAKNLDIINIAFGHVNNTCVVFEAEDVKEQIIRLKTINPNLRFLLSVGGWSAGSFSEAAYTDDARKLFATTALKWVNELGLSGIDLDWEYPCYTVAGISGCKEDKQNFTLLLKELRETFNRQDKNLMLTIAAGGGEYYLRGVEAKEISKYLDYIQLMTYDLRGGFQVLTGHHTGLFESEFDLFRASVDSAVKDFMVAGVPAEKLVIGVAFYSRIWTGVPNVDNGLIQMAKTTGTYGPNYGTLVESYVNKDGYTRYWDDVAKAPYLYNGDAFISYDDEESIAHKVQYTKDHNLLGLMYWEYCTDPTKTLTGVLRREADVGKTKSI